MERFWRVDFIQELLFFSLNIYFSLAVLPHFDDDDGSGKGRFHVRRRSSLSSSASQSTKRMKCLAMRRASSAVHMCVRLASVNVFTSTQQRIMVIFCGGSQPPSASDPFSIQYCCIDWDFSSSSFELFSFLLYTILPWLLALWDFFVLSLFFLSFSRWLAFLSISGSHSIRHRCPFHSLGLEDLHAQRTADIRSQQPSQSSNTKEASHIRAKDKEENQEKTKSNKNQRTNKQTKKKRWWLFCSIFRQGLAFSSSSSPSFYWALVTDIFFSSFGDGAGHVLRPYSFALRLVVFFLAVAVAKLLLWSWSDIVYCWRKDGESREGEREKRKRIRGKVTVFCCNETRLSQKQKVGCSLVKAQTRMIYGLMAVAVAKSSLLHGPR